MTYEITPQPRTLGSPQACGERLRQEYARAARHGSSLAVMTLHYFLYEGRTDADVRRVHRHVERTFAQAVRISDEVFDFGLPGCYVAVLPHTSSQNAQVVRQRFEQRANNNPVSDLGPVKIDVIPLGIDVPDVESLLAKLAVHFESQAMHPLGIGGPPTPPGRLPLGDLRDFGACLESEFNLAGREGSDLSVLSLHASAGGDVAADVLARQLQAVAHTVYRACDCGFSVGPNHIAVVLPRTSSVQAMIVGKRLRDRLATRFPDPAYGGLSQNVVEFDRTHCDANAVLTALGRVARLGF